MDAESIALGRKAIDLLGLQWTAGLRTLDGCQILSVWEESDLPGHSPDTYVRTVEEGPEGLPPSVCVWEIGGRVEIVVDPSDGATVGTLLAHLRALLSEPHAVLYWYGPDRPEGERCGLITVQHDRNGRIVRTVEHGHGASEFAALLDAAKRHLSREEGMP